MSNEPGTSDYGHDMRARALTMTEDRLRLAVDHLLEQCGREDTNPDPERRGLHTSEIYLLLGIGPHPGMAKLMELRRLIDRAIEAEDDPS